VDWLPDANNINMLDYKTTSFLKDISADINGSKLDPIKATYRQNRLKA
jgi:hypothetical protein